MRSRDLIEFRGFPHCLCFPPSSKVWGSLLEKGNAPGWMGGTRMGAGGPRRRGLRGRPWTGGRGAGSRQIAGPDRKSAWRGPPGPDTKRRAPTQSVTAPGPDTKSRERSAGPRHRPQQKAPGPHTDHRDVTKGVLAEDRRAPTPTLDREHWAPTQRRSAGPRHKEGAPGPRHKERQAPTERAPACRSRCSPVLKLYYQKRKIQPAAGDRCFSIKFYYQRRKIQPAAGDRY